MDNNKIIVQFKLDEKRLPEMQRMVVIIFVLCSVVTQLSCSRFMSQIYSRRTSQDLLPMQSSIFNFNITTIVDYMYVKYITWCVRIRRFARVVVHTTLYISHTCNLLLRVMYGFLRVMYVHQYSIHSRTYSKRSSCVSWHHGSKVP